MEVAAVVAITATLTAVVVPIVINQLGDARKQTAIGDCQNIAAAIGNFMKDTGRPPFYKTGTTPGLPSTAEIDVLTTAIGDTAADLLESKWTTGTNDTLENQLILNKPNTTGTPYKTTDTDFPWKGPYSAEFKADPWGNKYYVNVQHFQQDDTNVIWVLSAGPDKEIDTLFSQLATSGAKLADDDIGIRVK